MAEVNDLQAHGLLYPDKIYGLYENYIASVYGVFYNTDIFRRNGIPDLCDIKSQGNWNWDTFADIAVRLTQDVDGDGIIDQWGATSDGAISTTLAFMYSNLEPVIKLENGQYIYNLGSRNSLKALQFVSDLFNTYRVIPNENGESHFKNNKSAMYIYLAWYGLNFKNAGLSHVRFEEMPYGPDNNGTLNVKDRNAQYFFFPSNLEDPEGVVNAFAYWHVLWDESKEYYITDDEMYYNYGKQYMNEKDLDVYVNINKRNNDIEFMNFFGDDVRTLVRKNVANKIATQQTVATSAIETIRSQIESMIVETLAK